MSGIVFQVDTSRILAIIANEIYDSSLAMLRENLQNAYDAVRERFASSGNLEDGGRIDVTVSDQTIIIADNGVGMTEEVLRNNFWKAGSSGKHSERARKAGVVGTFGIGAMANFGVCTKLIVETRAVTSEITLRSTAELETLKIGEECITFEEAPVERDFGTTITVEIRPDQRIAEQDALNYLKQYVTMLPVPIYLNDKLISGVNLEDYYLNQGRNFSKIAEVEKADAVVSGYFETLVDPNGQILVRVTNLTLGGQSVSGSMALLQNGGQLMGLRSFFGLAPIPAAGAYQFGGYANLSFLHPTAGREAISRDCIDQTNRLLRLAEEAGSEALSKTEWADRNLSFLTWIVSTNNWLLAGRVTVLIHPTKDNVPLADIKKYQAEKSVLYYLGSSQEMLNTFSNENSLVLNVSQNNPRRRVQQVYIETLLKIQQVPTNPQILRVYKPGDLSYGEAAILIRVGSTLRDDYLIPDVDVKFADLSHGVAMIARQSGEGLELLISKKSGAIDPLLGVYDTAYSLFPQFIKDYVRVNVYQHIQQYVPTSTKGGVEALRRLLLKSKELYRIEEADRGDIEGILGEFLSGEASFATVLNIARTKVRPQTQRVSADQVGSLEKELPDISQTPLAITENVDLGTNFAAAPPIVRDNVSSDMKILTTSGKYPVLNNFTMFLGVSDKLMKTEAEFFSRPHTTRIIWGGHRVVFIFTEETETLSLYYDIELKNQIDPAKTSGAMFPTTTIITKRRVFIPIPEMLHEEFQVNDAPKEFYVRFDLLSADMD